MGWDIDCLDGAVGFCTRCELYYFPHLNDLFYLVDVSDCVSYGFVVFNVHC